MHFWNLFVDHWCRRVDFINEDRNSQSTWFSKCVEDVNGENPSIYTLHSFLLISSFLPIVTLEYYVDNGLQATGVDDFDTNDSDRTFHSATEFCQNYFYGSAAVLSTSMFGIVVCLMVLLSFW